MVRCDPRVLSADSLPRAVPRNSGRPSGNNAGTHDATKGRRSGSVIPNASTVILSGLHGGRVPSGHRAGTPPGYRAISVVQATIRSHLSRSNGSIRSSRPADRPHGGPQTQRARTYLAPGTRQGFFMILWSRTSSTPTSGASTSSASTGRGPSGPAALRSQGCATGGIRRGTIAEKSFFSCRSRQPT